MAEPEPRQSWTMPVAIVAAIAVLAVAGVVFALDRVESDAEREATKPAVVVERPQPPGAGGNEDPTDVAAWPAGTAAYTVVLARTSDEADARARATAALDGGVPAGVLDSDGYATLEPGMWVLFAGRFETQDEAAAEAARYAAAGFPDAEPAFVSEEG